MEKHLKARKSMNSGSSFINYKEYFSVVLLVTTHLVFNTIDVGSMRHFSDGNVRASSVLGQILKKEPLSKPLSIQLEATPFFL